MMDGYTYDIFLSYSHAGNVAGWVQRHLVTVLTDCLSDEIERRPKIFLDTRMDTGSYWPIEMERGLRHSRLMIAVLSPPYFSSKWCTAEWDSMILRERMLNTDTGLIFPLTFSDGDKFPDSAKARQCRSMKTWAYPYAQFAESPAFLPFHDEVKTIAIELAARLDAVPEWSPEWPIERPDSVPSAFPAELPEL